MFLTPKKTTRTKTRAAKQNGHAVPANRLMRSTLQGSVKSEPVPLHAKEDKVATSHVHVTKACSSKDSQKSVASIENRRKKLILEAAKQKAALQLDIINKTLEADLAALSVEEEQNIQCSSQIEGNLPRHHLEQWVEHQSNHIEPPVERLAPDYGITTGESQNAVPTLLPGAAPDTVQLLATALRNLTSTSCNNATNNSLLSRMSTPRDLPDFSGDQLEWLQFKQAYYESTELCGFTDKENLWRLRKCLRGAARDAVTALFISATSPEKVMSTLELRFGNPDGIIFRILHEIKRLQPLQTDYYKDIVIFAVKIQNYVEAVRAVGREEYLQGYNIVSIILSKLPTVLISKWSDYSYKLIKEGQKARLVILSDFLNDEAVKISTTASILFNSRIDNQRMKSSEMTTSRLQTVLVQSDNINSVCQFCKRSVHLLTECNQFKKALRKVRWTHVKKNGLCYKCLISKHDRDICRAPACDKDGCSQAHHRLLHYAVNNSDRVITSSASANVLNNNGQVSRQPDVSPPSETITHINASDRQVFLKVVPIRVHGPNGIVETTALLDDGSSVSLMSSELAARAGLRGRPVTLRVRGAFSDDELVCDSSLVNVNLTGIDNKVHNIRMRCIDNLNLPLQTLSVLNDLYCSHLNEIRNYLCTVDSVPQMLIGQDNHHLLLPLDIKMGKSNEPSATLTPLGWCVHGKLCVPRGPRSPRPRSPLCADTNLFVSEIDQEAYTTEDTYLLREIHEEVRRSFVLDTLGVSPKPRQNADEVHATALLEQSAVLVDGRWHVRLPWRSDDCCLPDSYPGALTRMKGIERKMSKDIGFATRYKERVSHLLQNNYARELMEATTTPSPRTWYLPHFGVDNPNKKKLRLVFDAACKVNGYCLNDYLLTGPDLLSSLFGIMLRFRENNIAVTGDIKDMFLRVNILAEDQHAFRFLWRNSPTEEMKTYVMTSLIFGANCSPFIAQFIKNKNAQRYVSTCPAAVDAICNSHYMDDYIDSLPDEATAIEMVRNISNIHKSGGFEIRNWTSNSVAVINSLPKETLGAAAVRFKVGQPLGTNFERTLGLIWYPEEDMLGFDMSLKRIPEDIITGLQRPSKRLMLKVIMSIFDVLGFLTPFTIQGRIMLQDTWRLNIGWDDNIPDDIYYRWLKWIERLKVIKNIRIPRCYKQAGAAIDKDEISTSTRASGMQSALSNAKATLHSCSFATQGESREPAPSNLDVYESVADAEWATGYSNLQLHIFCDASTKAMCTVGYWRWVNNNIIHVAFIASKCKVMPVKPLTVPRAELQAALLGARLANSILKEHKIRPVQRYFWCDSTTVLHWIRNNTRSYKTFEANRLGEIDELSKVSDWKYIPTKLNVADLATRESFDQSLQGEWFTGPKFLYNNECDWPKDVIQPELNTTAIAECVSVIEHIPNSLPVPDPLRFSSWLRLMRATAMVLKFIDKCKGHTGQLDCSAMDRAELLLLKHAQLEAFGDEIATLKNGKPLRKHSRLISLSPYLDEHDLLRVGGRIDAASDVSLDMKRPFILDGRHPVARLIVRHYHVKAAHGNQETVVNELRQRYWLLRLRPTVKYVVSRCMLCRIRKCKPQVPRMGDLPAARVAHHQRPFTHCGLDLFGPMDVTIGRRREKRYGVLFTCLTVRAVHIELVSSLTADALIMALRRMAARRGWPRHLYSDNGTNLRAADVELQRSLQDLDTEAMKNEGINNRFDWSFIPPASPHWGGAWERLIRSVKTSLKVVLNERAPREEILSTLLAEVENIVNSRPLKYVSVDSEDVESLTPNHFLIGTSSNLPLLGEFQNLCLRKQWRVAQRLADMFWQRWVKEILPTLIPRKKWHTESRSLQVGDLVLVVDPNFPRNTWPKGRITRVLPGKDGRTRLVEVQTGTGTWRRSAARVAPIPMLECCVSTGVGNVSDALLV